MIEPEQPRTEHLLKNCLFFTASRLERLLRRWAEEEFARTGLAPSAGFAVMVVNDHPGLNQNELARILGLAPSTLTRFVDALERRTLLARRPEGRLTFLEPTEAGRALGPELAAAWERVWRRYSAQIGAEAGQSLAHRLNETAERLQEAP